MYTKDTLTQRSAKDLSNDARVMFLCFLFLIIFYISICWGTYLNCMDKYTGYNLKTTVWLDCALIGLCALIR